MAKKSGLGANFYVGGYDLSNDIGALNNATLERPTQVVTGMDKSAEERIPLLYTSSISFSGFFNDAALQEHVALSALPTADTEISFLQSTTLGDVACGLTAKQIGYGWTRGQDGSLGITSEAQSNNDFLNWGKSLTAGKRTDTSGTNGTGVDFGLGDLSFGMVAYAHVFALTGTNVVLTIEESSDDGSGDAYAPVTGGAFTSVTSPPASERIETGLTQTVEDWLRVVSSGTFSSATFAVVAKIYQAANAER